MKVIRKKISLENFKSRLPSVVDYYDIDGEEFNFSGVTTLSGLMVNHSTLNYNTTPKDIIVSDTPLSSVTTNDRISYKNLSDIYSFMLNYKMMKSDEHVCGIIEHESIYNKNIIDGVNEDESLDDMYKKCGGEEGFNWIREKLLKVFTFDLNEFKNWSKDTLYLPEFFQWFSWFSERYKLYSGETNCSNSVDCCDCQEYFKLGGNDMFNKMADFVSNFTIDKNIIFDTSYINLQLLFNNTIDDLGEMSILAEEWENLLNYESKGGIVVLHNDSDWILKSGDTYSPSYYFSTKFKEGYFGNVQGMTQTEGEYFEDNNINDLQNYGSGDNLWEKYFNYKYLSGSSSGDVAISIASYAYKNDKIVAEPTIKNMADKFPIIIAKDDTCFVLVNGNVYQSFKSDYIVYKGKKYLVKYTKAANEKTTIIRAVPYIVYNSKNIYGVYVGKGVTKFDLDKKLCESISINSKDIEKDGEFFKINDRLYTISDDTITVNLHETQKTYKTFRCYVVYNDKILPLSFDNNTYDFLLFDGETLPNLLKVNFNADKLLSTSEAMQTDSSNDYNVFFDGDFLCVCEPYVKYNPKFVSGETESKLDDFISNEKTYDDLGNELKGVLMFNRNRPVMNSFLGFPYSVNTVRHLVEVEPYESYEVNGCVNDSSGSQDIVTAVLVSSSVTWSAITSGGCNSTDVKNEELSIINGTKYYWGDILYSIKIYYKDIYDNEVVYILDTCENYSIDNKGSVVYNYKQYNGNAESELTTTTKLQLNELVTKLDELKNEVIKDDNGETDTAKESFIDDTLYCDFTYYKGAILERKTSGLTLSGETFTIFSPYKLNDKNNFGVKYVETCKLEIKSTNYSLDDRFAYNVFYYDIIRTTKNVKYKNTLVEKNVANFYYPTSSYYEEGGKFINNFTNDKFFVDDNGFITSPVIREEYRFGISQQDKVQGKINIKRGNAQSIDKHLKLLSCKSFEALERYGNGYFEIKEV